MADSRDQSQSVLSGVFEVERLVPGGEGFFRAPDGRAVFVPGAAPGDRIATRAVANHGSYLRVADWSLVAAGSDRVTPPCPHAATCGGCDWMHLSVESQRRHKLLLVREALRRTGRLADIPEPIEMIHAGADLGYRRRARFHVDEDGAIGFFAEKTHRLVEVNCRVVHPEIAEAVTTLRRMNRSVLALFREVDVRHAEKGPPIQLRLSLRNRGGALPPAAREALRDLGERYSVSIVGRRAPRGAPQRYPLTPSFDLYALPGAFTQINWEVNAALVRAVVEGAQSRAATTFLDLYAGAGNFTLPLLAAGLRGIGIEREGAAVEGARRAARAAGFEGSVFITGSVEQEVARLALRGDPVDLVVLDPPRSGARAVLRHVIGLGAPWIAYCSCDPVTLARDLRDLVGAGYVLSSLNLYDVFPQTHHVETLAWLGRA